MPNSAHSFGLVVTSRALSTPHISVENSSYWANTSARLRGQLAVPLEPLGGEGGVVVFAGFQGRDFGIKVVGAHRASLV